MRKILGPTMVGLAAGFRRMDHPSLDGSSVTGIGAAAAAKIWFRALDVYMTSSTNYAGARTATLNAARDLYGNGSGSTTPSPPPGAP